MKTNLIVSDVETGGKIYTENPITEIYLNIVHPSTFKVISDYHAYIKPYNGLIITKEAIEVSQVSMKDINAGVDIKVVVKMIITKAKAAKNNAKYDKPQLVLHNAVFDKHFLEYAFEFCGEDLYEYVDEIPICTMRLMKLHDAGLKIEKSDQTAFKLSACCDRLGIKLKSAHGAKADTIATTEILKSLTSKLRALSGEEPKEGKKKPEEKSRKFFQF